MSNILATQIKIFNFNLNNLDLNYHQICEKEPIGKKLFQQFCLSDKKLKALIGFLHSSVSMIFISDYK